MVDNSCVRYYLTDMIKSFKHRGLKRYWESNDIRGLNANMVPRISRMLDALDQASTPTDMDIPGYRFHALRGNQEGRYSIRVTDNWRITFEFEGEDVHIVDLEDYH